MMALARDSSNGEVPGMTSSQIGRDSRVLHRHTTGTKSYSPQAMWRSRFSRYELPDPGESFSSHSLLLAFTADWERGLAPPVEIYLSRLDPADSMRGS